MNPQKPEETFPCFEAWHGWNMGVSVRPAWGLAWIGPIIACVKVQTTGRSDDTTYDTLPANET
jgi:hypothetical protein